MNKIITALLIVVTFAGCTTPAWKHARDLHSSADRNLTVGVVQRDIRKGMSASDVASALGSPNIVTKDNGDAQTWVYDKIATEASYSRDGGGLFLILGNSDSAAGASATTQKTLTVVIKFDRNDRVSDVNYHSTKF
jgi:outer membrane protein assembly factor BamE (lipoprotein component of BamABCDE complex)